MAVESAQFKSGWQKVSEDDATNMFINGKHCKSMLAYPSNVANEAKCVEKIVKIRTDANLGQGPPYRCNATNPKARCRYYYESSGYHYMNGKCECSLDGSEGYCKYPGWGELDKYA